MELKFYKKYISALQKFVLASQEYIYQTRIQADKETLSKSLKDTKNAARKLLDEINNLPKNMRNTNLIRKVNTALNLTL